MNGIRGVLKKMKSRNVRGEKLRKTTKKSSKTRHVMKHLSKT